MLAVVRMVRIWGWLLSLYFLGYQKHEEMLVGEVKINLVWPL